MRWRKAQTKDEDGRTKEDFEGEGEGFLEMVGKGDGDDV